MGCTGVAPSGPAHDRYGSPARAGRTVDHPAAGGHAGGSPRAPAGLSPPDHCPMVICPSPRTRRR